ncbi:WD repeat-containing protein 55 homolog [Uranotaenia lowii]|uniref:WD repeat-containing protein 55 homolog n=1 Tax=Uranotaenia lowii TaxID=190385 RepID=UPI002478E3F8|nr:WD repeat-containing protein 55 homolog [Uranotaenia lowii]XP_055586057.1 WD repeat-containing protein 55 homolog [Uranotaenia lowii]
MFSGDGYLATISIPQRVMHIQSEPYEEELTCMSIFRNDSELAVDSSEGNFHIFNSGEFEYCSDAFTGPKAGVNKIVPIGEQIAVIRCEDGFLLAMTKSSRGWRRWTR